MEVYVSLAREKVSVRLPLHFEPGIHPMTNSELDSIYQRFSTGDLDAHVWNTEVSKRIAAYAFNSPALLLTIDGLRPQPHSRDPFDTPSQEAIQTWALLPTRPNRLNHTNKMYVVKGDMDYRGLPQAVAPNKNESAHIEQYIDDKVRTANDAVDTTWKTSFFAENAGIAGIGAALWAANKWLAPNRSAPTLSRRKFLDRTLKVATGTLLIGRYETPYVATTAASVATDEQTKAFWQTVANVVRPRLIRSTYVDGRTALLLTKAEDAQAALADHIQAVNAVVMGTAHVDMVPIYLQDKRARAEAITAYTQELLAVAKQVYAEYFHVSPKQLPSQVVQSVHNYVSQTDIVQVTDSGGSSLQPNGYEAIDTYFAPVKSFHSPQVVEALKNLTPAMVP